MFNGDSNRPFLVSTFYMVHTSHCSLQKIRTRTHSYKFIQIQKHTLISITHTRALKATQNAIATARCDTNAMRMRCFLVLVGYIVVDAVVVRNSDREERKSQKGSAAKPYSYIFHENTNHTAAEPFPAAHWFPYLIATAVFPIRLRCHREHALCELGIKT